MAHDVFLTYSKKDQTTADAACAALERSGIRVWMAPRDVVPGADWPASIIGAINGSRAMVLIFSSHANSSQQVKREVERAVNKGIPVIPFRIEDVPPSDSLEYLISAPHWLDAFTPDFEGHLARLASAAKQLLEGADQNTSDERRETPTPSFPSRPPVTARPARATWRWVLGAAIVVAAVLAGWWRFSTPDTQTAARNSTGTPEPAPAAGATNGQSSPDVSLINQRLADLRAQTLLGFDAAAIPPAERTIKIAVLSTGVTPGMLKALGSRLQASSVVPGESDTDDLNGLGTSVTALLAALAPSATIQVIKIFSASGQSVDRLLAEGVKKATSDRADVIFVDGGGRTSSPELEEAVRAAVAAGALLVAPVGNDGASSVVFPAGYPGVLAVGSIERRGKLAEFTNRASGVLYAPGVDVTTIDENANPTQRSGTSLSAAVAAAMAAVVWAGKPQWSAQQVHSLLARTSTDLGPVDARNPKLGRIRRIDVTAAAKIPADAIGTSAPDASLACDTKCRREFSDCNIHTVNDVTSAAGDACRAELRACQAACATSSRTP